MFSGKSELPKNDSDLKRRLRQKLNVLIVGKGGREHAIAWKIRKSPYLKSLFIAPGNGGTDNIGTNIPLDPMDTVGICEFAVASRIDLVIIGPDDPLAAGLADALRNRKILVFGPSQKAARIESSKLFAKKLMDEVGIRTAAFHAFDTKMSAKTYVANVPPTYVIKMSGLAQGKGVKIARTSDEALAAIDALMGPIEEHAKGPTLIFETYLKGDELSLHVLHDGYTSIVFPSSQDHKAINEGEKGDNTGGMGVIAPVPGYSLKDCQRLATDVAGPIFMALAARQEPFVGCLYPGLKMTESGYYVLEYNARFGDPETQVYMRLLESDLVELLYRTSIGLLRGFELKWRPLSSATIVLSSHGYPGSYSKGFRITGIDEAERVPDVVIFHMGTRKHTGGLRTDGGRVLGVSATGATLGEALDRAYSAANLIDFEGKYMRVDIGRKYRS